MKKPVKFDDTHHVWIQRRSIPQRICRFCGLIVLNNPISHWAASKDCEYEDLPAFKRWKKTGVI